MCSDFMMNEERKNRWIGDFIDFVFEILGHVLEFVFHLLSGLDF